MQILNWLSIKWKLSLALILSGLILVGAYVTVAKKIFESDKIAYVFETQAASLQATRREIEGRLQRMIWVGRAVVFSLRRTTGKPSRAGEQVYEQDLGFYREPSRARSAVGLRSVELENVSGSAR